jgi:hypothetical protein
MPSSSTSSPFVAGRRRLLGSDLTRLTNDSNRENQSVGNFARDRIQPSSNGSRYNGRTGTGSWNSSPPAASSWMKKIFRKFRQRNMLPSSSPISGQGEDSIAKGASITSGLSLPLFNLSHGSLLAPSAANSASSSSRSGCVGKMKVWLGNGVVLLLDLQVSFIRTEAVAATRGLAQLGMMHTSCWRRDGCFCPGTNQLFAP